MIERYRDEHGQSLILLAVMGTFLTMMVALVIDAGMSFLTKRQIQNAADAASRAGANYLAQGTFTDAQIQTLITSVAGGNGCSSSGTPPCTPTASYIDDDTSGTVLGPVGSGIPSGAAGVKVTTQKTTTSFLASLLAQNQTEVSATASAIFGTLGAASCRTLFPATINGDTDRDGTAFGTGDFLIGACYLVRDDGGGPGNGSFGWVDLDPNAPGAGGAAKLGNWINSYATSGDTGCTNTITVGTSSANLETEPGAKASLQAAVLNLINSTNHNEITIAIYETYGSTGASTPCTGSGGSGTNLCYRVKGFARMRIANVWLTGSNALTDAQPASDSPCARSAYTGKGILAQFVGFIDPNGSISTSAQGPAKVVNVTQ